MMIQKWSGIIAVAFPCIALGAGRPEPNAFLDTPVASTGQLVREVQTDSAVRDRYQRHFGMSQGELTAYLSSLRVTRMPQAATVAVYSVPGSGAVKVHQQMLRKGEPVFSDANGSPQLLVRCGNPLSLGPTNAMNMSILTPIEEDTSVLALHPLPIIDSNALAVVQDRPMIAMEEPPDTIADEITEPETTRTVVVPTPPVTEVVPPPAPQVISAGGGGAKGIFFLPLLGAGAIIGILESNHGGTPISPTPVPEPVGVVLLASASIALIRRSRRR